MLHQYLTQLLSIFHYLSNNNAHPQSLHPILPNTHSTQHQDRLLVRVVNIPSTMKYSIIASALLHLASLAYAAPGSSVKPRQEFEVSITFIGEGPDPSTYSQQFPTDNQPYPISKQSFHWLNLQLGGMRVTTHLD